MKSIVHTGEWVSGARNQAASDSGAGIETLNKHCYTKREL